MVFSSYISFNVIFQTVSEYALKIEARDLEGDEFGLCSTTEVIISIGDINDNIPQLLQNLVSLSLFSFRKLF